MSDKVAFLLEGQEVLTYDRSQVLPEKQVEYLDIIDTQMDEGFVLSDKKLTSLICSKKRSSWHSI